MSQIRTRFAPSPTGFLHLGSARTALFNWAFARRHGGHFILRVEDTDRQRSTSESEAQLIDGLQWLGLDWDEGPIRQTERRARHDEAIEQLLERGAAYRCRATPQQIEAEREKALAAGQKFFVFQSPDRDADLGPDCGPHAVRLKVPREGFLGWNDLVFGESGQDADEIGDLVIRRTDGSPLFYLTGAVDDIDMGVTHVIRGADHHSNTPFQIALYRALGAEPPRFAHVPLIVGESGKKLSKRRDPVSVQQFRADGYLAQALDNWLVRLGWSHGDDEIFSLDDIARLFSLEAVGRAPARADASKLQWLNQHYIKELPSDELFEAVRPFVEDLVGGPVERTPAVDKVLDLLRERSKTLAEMADLGRWMWLDPESVEPKAAKHLKPSAAPIVRDLIEALEGLEPWTDTAIEEVFERVRAHHGDVGMGKLAQPVRAAVTGRSYSPGIYETLEGVGRERSLARLRRALESIED
jgi:glutamyl-tRNA synthetase